MAYTNWRQLLILRSILPLLIIGLLWQGLAVVDGKKFDQEMMKLLMLKVFKQKNKVYIPIPLPIPILPILLLTAKKKMAKESEIYFVHADTKPRAMVKKYIHKKGGIHALYV